MNTDEIMETSEDIGYDDMHCDNMNDKVSESECSYVCPVCITRTCILTLGHYCDHQCSEGHTWK